MFHFLELLRQCYKMEIIITKYGDLARAHCTNRLISISEMFLYNKWYNNMYKLPKNLYLCMVYSRYQFLLRRIKKAKVKCYAKTRQNDEFFNRSSIQFLNK